jgi:hypothetical protein
LKCPGHTDSAQEHLEPALFPLFFSAVQPTDIEEKSYDQEHNHGSSNWNGNFRRFV